uniref:Uncharacterized protein n=1 Tax=Cyprinus carpio carpio TaxID=630221 RepID=A0A9J8CB73_CYPCA
MTHCRLWRSRSRNRFDPLNGMERNAVIVGNSIVRHVSAALAKAAADGDSKERLQEPERDSMQHIARDEDHCVRTCVPTYRRGHKRFSRLFALNKSLLSWCKEQNLLFVNNWNLFWERHRLFVLMACTPAGLERNSYRRTSPEPYAPYD